MSETTQDFLLIELDQHIREFDTMGETFTVADTLSLLRRVRQRLAPACPATEAAGLEGLDRKTLEWCIAELKQFKCNSTDDGLHECEHCQTDPNGTDIWRLEQVLAALRAVPPLRREALDEGIAKLREAVKAWDDTHSAVPPLFREDSVWKAVRDLLRQSSAGSASQQVSEPEVARASVPTCECGWCDVCQLDAQRTKENPDRFTGKCEGDASSEDKPCANDPCVCGHQREDHAFRFGERASCRKCACCGAFKESAGSASQPPAPAKVEISKGALTGLSDALGRDSRVTRIDLTNHEITDMVLSGQAYTLDGRFNLRDTTGRLAQLEQLEAAAPEPAPPSDEIRPLLTLHESEFNPTTGGWERIEDCSYEERSRLWADYAHKLRREVEAQRGIRKSPFFMSPDPAAVARTPEPPPFTREPTWQPMESAPKDGREVLLWWAYWSKRPTIGYWKHDRWVAENALVDWAPGPQPTHWMPLPDPPLVELGHVATEE